MALTQPDHKPAYKLWLMQSCVPWLAAVAFLLMGLSTANAAPEASMNSQAEQTPQPNPLSIRKGPVEVTLKLDKHELMVAEPVQWTIKAQAPRGVELQLSYDPESWSSFNLLDESHAPAVPQGQDRVWVWRFEMDSLTVGDAKTPPLMLTWHDRRSSEPDTNPYGEMTLPQLDVKVVSILEADADPTQIRSLKPPLPMPAAETATPWFTITLIAGGTAAALALAFVAVMVLRHRKVDPATTAMQQLDQIQSRLHDADDHARALAMNLTVDTLRQYLEARCDLHAMRMTHAELLCDIEHRDILNVTHCHDLHDLLQSTDYVKFACVIPDDHQVERAVMLIKNIITSIESKLNSMKPELIQRESINASGGSS